jgi:hypothetical protein
MGGAALTKNLKALLQEDWNLEAQNVAPGFMGKRHKNRTNFTCQDHENQIERLHIPFTV